MWTIFNSQLVLLSYEWSKFKYLAFAARKREVEREGINYCQSALNYGCYYVATACYQGIKYLRSDELISR